MNEGDTQLQGFVDGTESIIIWTCTKGTDVSGLPPLYYWKHKILKDDPWGETRKEVASTIIRKYAEGVWQGVVQSGVGSFDADAADRAHIRYVGAFDLRSWGGTPIPREINIHMVAKYSLNDGATWTTCGDTGWKSSGSPRSEFSVEFYKLASSCPGDTRVHTRARFLQASGTWWTSGWLVTGPVPAPPTQL